MATTTTTHWWQSKTILFNVITAILAIVSEIAQVFPLSQHPKLYASVLAVGNILLRFLTNTPITGTTSNNTTPPSNS